MKKTTLLVATICAFTFAVSASATTTTTRDAIKNARQEAKSAIKDAKQNLKEFKKEEVQKFQQARQEATRAIKQKRDDFKNQIVAKQQELKDKLQKDREALKEKLQKIKDERKKTTAEKINNDLNALSGNRVKQFTGVLEKLEKVLNNISTRAEKAKANGKNIDAVNSAITAAQTAIAQSRSAIQIQAGKTYVLTINAEATLKTDVGKTRQALHADLTTVQKTVEAAHKAVRKAAATLAQIPKVDDLEVTATTPTPSPSPSETPNQ